MSITTEVVSSNPAHGELYSIQHFDKVCQWLAVSPGTPVSSINKTDCHDITEKYFSSLYECMFSNKNLQFQKSTLPLVKIPINLPLKHQQNCFRKDAINYFICCKIQMFPVSVRLGLQIFNILGHRSVLSNMLNWVIVNEIITLLILISMTTYLYPKNCRSENRILIPEGESPHFKHALFHFAMNFQV